MQENPEKRLALLAKAEDEELRRARRAKQTDYRDSSLRYSYKTGRQPSMSLEYLNDEDKYDNDISALKASFGRAKNNRKSQVKRHTTSLSKLYVNVHFAE